MSARKAWRRLQEKHSPSVKTFLSPIKHICYNSAVDEMMMKDPYLRPQIWALLNLEEFYYQNSSSLVYHEFHNESNLLRILRDSRLIINWSDRLEYLTLIGQGSFGDVYKGEDKETKKMFALKKVIKQDDIDQYATSFVKSILLEKGTLYDLNKTEYFVRLVGAFQEKGNGAYWLVMEFCICDLTKLVKTFPKYGEHAYLTNEYINGYLLLEVNEFMSDYFSLDYKKLAFQYLFEMLCGMHYLSRRHIVHTDLKTDNVLISQTGHIKIGDFGLAFNDSWFHRNSVKMLVHTEREKDAVDRLDLLDRARGNTMHYDTEMSISHMIKTNPKLRKRILEQYGHHPLITRDLDYNQIFLTDLFAVGFIAVQMLFGGLNIKLRPAEYKCHKTVSWSIDISYDDHIYEEYILRIFRSSATSAKETSVMEFLASFFLPRDIRLEDYVEDLRIFSHGDVTYESAIDINKVGEIPYYKSIQMDNMTVLNLNMPEGFINLLKGTSKSDKEQRTIELRSAKRGRKVINLPTFGFADSKYLR